MCTARNVTLLTVLLSVAGCQPTRMDLAGRCFEPLIVDEQGQARSWPETSPYWYTPRQIAFSRDSVGRPLEVRPVPGLEAVLREVSDVLDERLLDSVVLRPVACEV